MFRVDIKLSPRAPHSRRTRKPRAGVDATLLPFILLGFRSGCPTHVHPNWILTYFVKIESGFRLVLELLTVTEMLHSVMCWCTHFKSEFSRWPRTWFSRERIILHVRHGSEHYEYHHLLAKLNLAFPCTRAVLPLVDPVLTLIDTARVSLTVRAEQYSALATFTISYQCIVIMTILYNASRSTTLYKYICGYAYYPFQSASMN